MKAKGYAAQSSGAALEPWEFERRTPAAHDVVIEILFCGVCHTDLHMINSDWGFGTFPMVPGHEIVGRIIDIGDEVTRFQIGNHAGVGVMVDSCGTCPDCSTQHEHFCSVSPVQTYGSIGRDGLTTYGGYSNVIVVDEKFTHLISDKLDLAGAAPLLCAGITTYSPLRKWKVGIGHKLAVVGLGGLGHMAVKFGIAFGAEVTVLSTSETKRDDAKKLGAHHFVVTSDSEELNKVKGRFDFILDTISAKHDLNMYLSLLKTDGVHICVGIPSEPYSISPFSLPAGNKVLAGSGAGGLAETQEMLDFCAANGIVSEIEVIDIKNIDSAFDRMAKGDVRYRFVIDLATLR
jgi:uncharacterized zinc-type alcohol dehydrogenase-like protein